MAEDKQDKITEEETEFKPNVIISEEVVATIAAVATGEIPGVGGMCGSKAGEIIERYWKKNAAKGVKVEMEDNTVKININLLVNYGCVISDVCREVQKAVKSAVESMTGLTVTDITLLVHGLASEDEAL